MYLFKISWFGLLLLLLFSLACLLFTKGKILNVYKRTEKEISHHVQLPDENEVISLNSFLYHHISMIERKKKAINKGKKLLADNEANVYICLIPHYNLPNFAANL